MTQINLNLILFYSHHHLVPTKLSSLNIPVFAQVVLTMDFLSKESVAARVYRVLNHFSTDGRSMLEMTSTHYFFLTQLKFQKPHLLYPYLFPLFLSLKPKLYL